MTENTLINAKYQLTKLNPNHFLSGCWYEIPVIQVKQLFEDERFSGEIVHLFNDSDNGAESLIQSGEQLEVALIESIENHSPFVILRFHYLAQAELFDLQPQRAIAEP